MLGFNRIDLSRKGFESSTGMGYSPFDPESGKFIVLPIPQSEDESKYANKLKYEEIKIKKGYFSGHNASNIRELMEEDRRIGRWPPVIRSKSKSKNKSEESEYAHFDPWLGPCPWLEESSNHSVGAFGQVAGRQTTLSKNGVERGSLFLFFNRFKSLSCTGFDDIEISAKHLHKDGVYFIYGWLKVGEIIRSFEDIGKCDLLTSDEKRKLTTYHPHARREYFDQPTASQYKNNTIYIATKRLLDNSSKPLGCGYFKRLSRKLLLTADESAQANTKWLPSSWKMPPGLTRESALNYKDEWLEDNLMRHEGPGQEFVFKETADFCRWFEENLLPEMD